jgi:mannose-6-phosphate isomerase-like protein (cupin superfamily)
MESENKTFKQEINVKWIRANSGQSYLCPANALDRISNPTEEDLKRICVDESQNPQND